MPKYVRREPLLDRIKAYLNPFDFLLWLSEELDGWDQLEKEWAVPIGVAANLAFLVARANSKNTNRSYDDVFGDTRGAGWTSMVCSFVVHFLALLSLVNAVYTFWRKKQYRLFEASVDAVPSTPSAHRVRVDSSPAASSPLQFLSNLVGTDNAQSRAHPDAQRDVWQVAIWDPLPVCLRFFCYFSPGHVMIYWLFLPTNSTDQRPSTTIATTMFLGFLLSVQMSLLQSNFSQQSKDSALISKEVLHEYDTKFVQPRTQPLYRDVGTQFSEQAKYEQLNSVDTYTPSVVVNRGFKTNPNPSYAQHTDPDGSGARPAPRSYISTPGYSSSSQVLRTPATFQGGSSSPIRPATAIRQPVFRPTAVTGDGGSLGVYSHAQSPLRKSASTNFDARAYTRPSIGPEKRSMSPEKRMSVPLGGVNTSTAVAAQRWGHLKPDRARRESGRF